MFEHVYSPVQMCLVQHEIELKNSYVYHVSVTSILICIEFLPKEDEFKIL